MQYVYFRCATKRGYSGTPAHSYDYERIAIDDDLICKMRNKEWTDPLSWEETGIDIDDCTEFTNLYPLSGEPCFAIVKLFSEDGYEEHRFVVNGEAEILTKHGDLLERIF